MSKPRDTDQEFTSSAVQLANFIEHTRLISEAYAKLALLLEDPALEPRLERKAAGNIRTNWSRGSDPQSIRSDARPLRCKFNVRDARSARIAALQQSDCHALKPLT
jgi:hypothetical protein